MKQTTFKHFQIGMLEDPSIEDKGGFEFASGMDIFSEPGVMKACYAMAEVSYGASATPTDVPRYFVDTTDASATRGYIAAGAKILESTTGTTWNLFRTNGQGVNLGLGIWAGYVIYPSATKIGRTLVGDAAAADDSYITTLDNDAEFHPVLPQGGTLKIGAGRYIASLDESFSFTARAMKLASDYRIRTLTEYLNNLFMGTRLGAGNISGGVLNQGSSVFSWKGIVLSSGSALPDTPYPMILRGMNALLTIGTNLFGFPDQQGDILNFDGIGFNQYRKLLNIGSGLTINPGAVCQHIDNSVLFSGSGTAVPGVYQMKDCAICQAFVPVGATPGTDATFNIGLVKTSFNGVVFMGYYKSSDTSYHIAYSTANRQNNAMMRTLWHRIQTDRLKRWYGVKLNLKPLAASCSVAVAYRTSRDAAFTDSGYTITSANQDKPVMFAVQPRSREIQFKFTYTTSTTTTPELLSYDPLYEVLNATR